MLPPDKLWPINPDWDFHAGGGVFGNIRVFAHALDERYGPPKSVDEFARKAQVMAYEGERAMFEAYGRNKFASTGVIQWMLNNAWPSMIWHLYDWYMRPGGSYFGTKKGCEPLHVQYSYDDRSIVVVSSYLKPFSGLKLTAKVYNLDMAEKFSREAAVEVPENSSTRIFTLPDIKGLSSTHFLNLVLADASGNVVSRNFYWLSATPETLDWENSTWYYTPTRTFANYTALNSLPQVDLRATARTFTQGAERLTIVTVTNPSNALAFAVHLKVVQGTGGDEILPVLWQDGYFALLPGESRQVTATSSAAAPPRQRDEDEEEASAHAAPVVEIDGWNVKPKVVTPSVTVAAAPDR
jgi:exo-1,4-beta-D-glucosaminidase